MQVKIVKILNLTFNKVQYFSVVKDGNQFSEYRDFLMRMLQKPALLEDLQLLSYYIEKIGQFYGADLSHFKSEGKAERLPPPYHFVEGNFGLRLYCIRVNENIVILLNGDHKTAQKVQDCPFCYTHFLFANQFANAFWNAIDSGFIEIKERGFMYNYEDFILEV